MSVIRIVFISVRSYFDFDMNPLKINYIECHIECEINKYLYSLKEKFINSYGSMFKNIYGDMFFLNKPKLTRVNGIPSLPFPKSYNSCVAKICKRLYHSAK